MTVQAYKDCENRVRGCVSNMTDAQIKAVAEHHHTTGDCVWHSVHVVLGTPRCHCGDCNPPVVAGK